MIEARRAAEDLHRQLEAALAVADLAVGTGGQQPGQGVRQRHFAGECREASLQTLRRLAIVLGEHQGHGLSEPGLQIFGVSLDRPPERRRRLGEATGAAKGAGEARVRLVELRIQLDGGLIVVEGRGRAVSLLFQLGQAQMRRRLGRRIGADRQHPLEGARRLLRPAELAEDRAEIDQRLAVGGIESQQTLELSGRLFGPADVAQGRRPLQVGRLILGVDLVGPLEVDSGLLEPAVFGQQAGQIEVAVAKLRVDLDRALQPGLGRRAIAQPQQGDRQVVRHQRIVRLLLEGRPEVAHGLLVLAGAHGVDPGVELHLGAAHQRSQAVDQGVSEAHPAAPVLRQVVARPLGVTRPAQGDAQPVVDRVGLRLQFERLLEARDGRLEVAAAGSHPAETVDRRGAGGVEAQGLGEGRLGLVQPAAGELHLPQADPGRHVRGPQRRGAPQTGGGLVEGAVDLLQRAEVVRPAVVVRLQPPRVDEAGGGQIGQVVKEIELSQGGEGAT